MISDNKLQTFSWISPFILLYNSECRVKDEDTIVGFCLFSLRFAIQILISKCLFSMDFRIELRQNYIVLPWVNASWSLKESDDLTVLIYHRQSPFVLTKEPRCSDLQPTYDDYNNDINNSVYQHDIMSSNSRVAQSVRNRRQLDFVLPIIVTPSHWMHFFFRFLLPSIQLPC